MDRLRPRSGAVGGAVDLDRPAAWNPGAFALACVIEAAGVMASVSWQTTLGVFAAAG